MNITSLLNTPIDQLDFSVVDVETTGMNAEYGRVIDIGIVKMRGSKVIEKWETLIDPKQEVPYWITHYTHLSNKDVDGQPTFDYVMEKISGLLQNSVFVAHNVMFDYSFLFHEYKRNDASFELPKLCTVQLGRRLVPELPRFNLDTLSFYFGIKIVNRHRAMPDAEATAVIFGNFLSLAQEEYRVRNFLDLERLQRFGFKKPEDTKTLSLFENYP